MYQIKHKSPFVTFTNIALLLGLLCYVIFLHYGLHNNKHEPLEHYVVDNYGADNNRDVEYTQTAGDQTVFLQPVAHNNWRIDYSRIEKILWQIKVGESGQMLINSSTLGILQRVNAQLPDSISKQEWQRLSWVLTKSFTEGYGKQLAELLNAYYVYQQEYAVNLDAIQIAKADDKLILLKALTTKHNALQQAYFSADIAKSLFAKENANFNYVTQRRITHLRTDLSPIQKQEILFSLKTQYENTLSKLDDEINK